jgi:hypothetical protein
VIEMDAKIKNLLYSVVLGLGIITSFFFESMLQKVVITMIVTVLCIGIYLYNKKESHKIN